MATSLYAPRAAEERPKSGTLDFPDSYGLGMRMWKQKLLEQASMEVRSTLEYQEIERYIDYLEGKFYDANRPVYRSKFYDNYMADQRIEALAALSDVKPYVDISCKVPAYEKQGKVGHGYMHYLWHKHRLDLKIVGWIDHALFGTGFMKNTCMSPGRFQFAPRGMDTVMPVLMMDNNIQTSTAVIDKSYLSMGELIARFGAEKCRGLERYTVKLDANMGAVETYARPANIPQYTWNAMSPALKRRRSRMQGPSREVTTGGSPFGSIECLEIYYDDWSINEDSHPKLIKHPDLDVQLHNYHYIVPPNARMWPRKRLIIFAGDRVMYDGPNPFWHGQYPYGMLQLNPCVWSPGGISKYRGLVPLQESLNRIGCGIDETVAKALNPNVIGVRGKITEAFWEAFNPGRAGQKILMNPMAAPTDLRWMEAPTLPSYVGDFMRYLVDTIKKRSGSLDIQGLSRKKQAPGGEAIEQMRDTLSGPFRLEGRYLEAAMEQVAEQILSNIFQFCDVDERLRVLGADGMTWEDFDYKAGDMVPATECREDWWRSFSIQIAPGSLHGNSKSNRDQKAFMLAQAGKLSMRGLYRQTEFPEDVDQVMKELAEEHQQGIGAAPQKGRTPRPKQSLKSGRG